MYRCSFQKVVT